MAASPRQGSNRNEVCPDTRHGVGGAGCIVAGVVGLQAIRSPADVDRGQAAAGSAANGLAAQCGAAARRCGQAGTATVVQGHRTAHVPVFLGHHQRTQWPDPGPLPVAAVCEHRGGRLRTDGIPDRRGERLGQSRPGGGPYPDHAEVLPRPAPRPAGDRQGRVPRLLLPLPRHGQRPSLCQLGGAVERGHGAADDGDAVRAVLLRPRRCARGGDPRTGRRAVQARELDLAAAARAAGVDGLVPGERLHRARLARIQRGHAAVCARAGFADPPGQAGGVDGLDANL